MNKRIDRLRRAAKGRAKIKELKAVRLTVHRTPMHIYAQLIMPDGKVIVAASTLEVDIKKSCPSTGNVAAAKVVGKIIAERAKVKGILEVAFDRSGFKYHGRVLALAEAARASGLKF